MVVIVREKYTVIQVVATWKMSVPGRTLKVTASTTIPTARRKLCQRWICSDLRHRTCVRNHKDDCWDDDLEASAVYNVQSPYLSESSGGAKNVLVVTHNYSVPHYRLKAQASRFDEGRWI